MKRFTGSPLSYLTIKRKLMKTGNLNREENSVKWSESKEIVTKKNLKGKRPMNPCPIYAKKSHTLYLFVIGVEGIIPEAGQIFWGINKASLFFISTKDGGKTWNDITELTDNLSQVKNWATFAVGPGHGVQTETGRLIVPAYAYPSCCSCCEGGRRCLATLFCWCGPFGCTNYCCPPPHALIIYSDNDEKSLKNGKMLEETSLECEIAEISDEQGERLIYCNARSWGGLRVEAVAKDCEDSFRKVTSKLVQTGTGCQGSVVSFPAQPEESGLNPAPLWLLYSHPTSQSKRVDLGIYLHNSSQDPGEWSKPWVINPGPSGYSDLAYMEDGLFACLMECGEKSEIEQIACLFFTYDDVQQGILK
ncbi:PREDICTED: sialidase-3-like [Cyprinodon variegatus]|uniref:sialidase-3-like n=1 Tax=Cyprinodon variegatus TaxID=28743 RepID=UPI000742BDAA|nr:PREDICTED: sialidase-3-like [Cyprinodon variegatus]